MPRQSSRTPTRNARGARSAARRAELRDDDERPPEVDSADDRAPAGDRAAEDATPEEERGRFMRLSAGWKVLSGVAATAAAVVGVLAPLGIIGAGGGTTPPSEAVASAATKAADAGSSKLQLTVLETPPGGGPETDRMIVGSGEFDYRRSRGRMEYDLSRLPGMADLYAVEVLFNGPSFFVHDPGGPNGLGLPGGKEWLLVRFADLAQVGPEYELIRDLQIDDPAQALEQVESSSGGARLVGKEPYYGVPTKHYRSERDPDGAGPTPPTQVDVWVDEKGYLRKLETLVRSESGTVATRTELDGFGVEVDTDLPPRSRVHDLARG